MGQGRQIDSLPHKTDKCNTKHALKVFLQDDKSVDGFCFACGTRVPDPYGEPKTFDELPAKKVKTPEQIAEELAEIQSYKTLDVPVRKLRQKSLDKYEAKVAVSEKDGITPFAIYFPIKKNGELTGYHVKLIDPPPNYVKAYNLGESKDCDLLNWDKARTSGAHTLIVTEGPEDMVSVDRIFEMHGDAEWFPAVVSLPFGASSAKHFMTKHANEIRKNFKRVVLSFDDDAAGEKAVKDAVLVLPDAVSVTLPFKDANECLLQGAAKAAYNRFRFAATTPKNTSLIFAPAIHMEAREPAKYGELTWPFPKLNDLTRGIRYGETYYIGAGVKMGKSELRDEVGAHFIKAHNSKVFMASFEESIKKTYKKIVGKVASRILHDPKREFDYDAYDKAGEILKDNLALLNVYQQASVENFKYDIINAAEWGAKSVFVDPITNFTNGIDAATSNTILQGMAQSLAIQARDLELAIFIFCHLKEPIGNLSKDDRESAYKAGRYIGLGNCPHEYGGDVMSAQFAGSRGMMRSCNYMIGIEGNKDPSLDKEVRNIRQIKILEDREFGEAGIIPVYWDEATGRFTEM